ncbi:hypothetical protein CPJCM30710_27840 [Clostridium polyendosporum]|uniref:Uncharacterized protein n=1 Tax=Clostridium polyendosporum TaxID=69208 RepID=A0A919S2N1_9CLOT|nr:hypothetical protein [Clostridium polyendosporum]GIM30118.1 hypothetical protein CPJCM30710_27840 [Clostridium polyendosporum]
MNTLQKKELAFTRIIEALRININSLYDLADANDIDDARLLCEQLDDKVSSIYYQLNIK